jgi:hypothetical protein
MPSLDIETISVQHSIIICTAANGAYFNLLHGLIASLRGAARRGLRLGILDLGGMSDDQKTILRDYGAILTEPGWDCDFPGRETAPLYYRAMTARPYLPKHFPGYDLYLWIDADAWVQDEDCLVPLLRAAAQNKLAIVSEFDRCYLKPYKRPKLWTQNHETFAASFGLTAGYRLGRTPRLNSGVFALAKDAPHWQLWAAAHQRILNRIGGKQRARKKSFFFIAEQTALNYVVFGDRQDYTILPATFNWLCSDAAPKWDERIGRLVEPHEPHTQLGIIHLAGANVKDRVWDIEDLSGGHVHTLLTYDAITTLRNSCAGTGSDRGRNGAVVTSA